ncbi:MAG: glycosyltransferase family 4 protein [Bacteroidota bacterium]|nr:glycosyltransferase family 4 protein [Bacteroidota bacterium]
MHILQISNKAPYPPNDGSSIAVYNMAKGFIDNGVELHLLTVNTKKHFKDDELVPEEFKKQSNYVSVYRDTDVKPIGALLNLFSSQSFFVSRFLFKEFEEAVIKKLQENAFDIIHIEGLFMAPYMSLIKKHSKAKITLRAHNVEHLIWDRLIKNEKSTLKKWYLSLQNKRLKKLELAILDQVDGIVPITSYDMHLMKGLGLKKKYCVSPTGILLNRYKVDKSNIRSNTFFHLASMDWMPNIEAVDWFLDEVWGPYLKNEKVEFKLAGRFMPDKYIEFAEGNLEVQGAIDNNIDFYNQHEVMIVPLQSGSGMRIKIVEGLALGKVIISTSIGAEGIQVKHGENILIADSPKEFADAIKLLINNKELKEKISHNARKFIEEKFDNTKLIAELIAFYKTL